MATVEWQDVLALVGYFVIVMGVGIIATLKANTSSTEGYFLAGQKSNWLLTGASTYATNIGTPMFIGLAGSAAASGISVVMFEWHAMLTLVALGWVFMPVYRASGSYTMPQYLKLRYGGDRIRLLLAFVNVGLAAISQISGQMYAGALFIRIIFQWDIYAAILLILAITAAYTVIGGLTAVLWTDAAQTVILIAGSIYLAFVGLTRVGGWEGITAQYPQAAANYTVLEYALHGNHTCGLPRSDWLHIFRSHDADYPWPGMTLGLTILATYAWCTDQVCVQRSLSAKSISHAKMGVLLAAYLKILPFLFFIIPGMISRILFPNEIACADPTECRRICGNPSGCSNIAYPLLVTRILPTGMRGVMLADLLAALMSSLTSVFNSSSTLFTLDIYNYFRKKASQAELMVVGRIYILFLVGLSIAWIPILEQIQGSQFWHFVQAIASYIRPPIVASFYLGLFWKGTTEAGAFYGMVIGIIIGIIRMTISFSILAPPCGDPTPNRQPYLVSSVHYMHFACISLLLSGFLMVCISLVTQPRTTAQLRRVTFWTRHDPLPLDYTEELQDSQMNANGPLQSDGSKGSKPTLKQKLLKILCGVDNSAKTSATKREVLEYQRKATDIEEDPRMEKILDLNAIIALAVCVFIHAFFA